MASKEEETKEFTPPTKIEELYKKAEGNKFASINRPTAGPREERALPVGSSALQLYSLATPNGWKVLFFFFFFLFFFVFFLVFSFLFFVFVFCFCFLFFCFFVCFFCILFIQQFNNFLNERWESF